MSRPRETERASERVTARAALDRITPALTTLRVAVRDGDTIDRTKAEELLCNLFADMEIASDHAAALEAIADAASDPAASAMLAYLKAARRNTNAASVRTTVERMAKAAGSEQAKALLDLIVAATRSPKIPTYAEEFIDILLAAGLTKNRISATQREGIAAILNNPDWGKSKRIVAAPVAPPGPQPVIAASWESLPDPVPGFTFERRKVYQNALDRAVLDAGLPPATSIDFFVANGSIGLANIPANRDKANFIWQSIKRWLATSGMSDPRLDIHRRPAWVFLLGYVHGFLPGVETIDKVSLVSPWASDEVIHARRIIEKVPADATTSMPS